MTSKTEELRGLLRKKVLGPEGQGARAVFLQEVTAGPEGEGRRLDAISMGMWRSRGCLVDGYELKVSRGDWMGELREPAKAHALACLCDRFWLVTGSADVADVADVPPKWGLMTRAKNGRGLSTVRDAAILEPDPRPPEFFASLLRRAVREPLAREVRVAQKQAKEEADRRVEIDLRSAQREADYAKEELEEYREAWKLFLDATGENFPDWVRGEPAEVERVAKVVSALRSVKDGKVGLPTVHLDQALERIDRVRKVVEGARDEISSVLNETADPKEVVPTTNP